MIEDVMTVLIEKPGRMVGASTQLFILGITKHSWLDTTNQQIIILSTKEDQTFSSCRLQGAGGPLRLQPPKKGRPSEVN